MSKVGVFVGGIMMGHLEPDLDAPVTKTMAGMIVLPEAHALVMRKRLTEAAKHRIGKSRATNAVIAPNTAPGISWGTMSSRTK